jgi:peptidoglycan/LPS O-acetylase OafA/YrhL
MRSLGNVSFGDVLDRNRGNGPGFDTLRLLLAIMIVCWHSNLASYGTDDWAWRGYLGFYARPLLPMFFAISGFLVMGSAFRTDDLRRFLTLRALRIVPALAVEITLSALVLGPVLTTLPLWDYVTSPSFHEYFGNVIGRISYFLPGVFETNPYPGVINVSLWTIPLEILCYVLLGVQILAGLFKRRIAMTVFVAVLACVCIAHDILQTPELMLPGRTTPQMLVVSYLFGNLLYLWKDRIPYSAIMFGACLCIGLLFVRVSGLTYLASLCLVYCIIFLGLTPLPKIPVLSRGDYSYGIYLYGFPMQQLVAYSFPGMHEWYWSIMLALPLAIAVAVFSWTFVEKPCLDLRKRLAAKGQPVAGEYVYGLTFMLMSALLLYGVCLMRWGTMNFWERSSTADMITFAAIFGISGLCVGVMARLTGWSKPALSLPGKEMWDSKRPLARSEN